MKNLPRPVRERIDASKLRDPVADGRTNSILKSLNGEGEVMTIELSIGGRIRIADMTHNWMLLEAHVNRMTGMEGERIMELELVNEEGMEVSLDVDPQTGIVERVSVTHNAKQSRSVIR